MFRSSFFRTLFLPFLVVIVLATAGLGVFAAFRLRSVYLESRRNALHAELQLTASIIGDDMSAGRFDQVQLKIVQIGQQVGCRVTVIASDGRVLGDNWADPARMENHLERPEVLQAAALGEGSSARASATVHEGMLYLANRVKAGGDASYFLRLAVRLRDLSHELWLLYGGIAGFAAVITGGAVALGYRHVGRQAQAVVELTSMADIVAKGGFHRRSLGDGGGEIGTLRHALNTMAESLEGFVRQTEKDKAELLTILASMAEGVIATDAQQNILVANHAAASLLGFDLSAVTGKPLWQVVRMERIIKAAQDAQSSGLRSMFELGMVAARHLEVTLSPIHAQEDGTGGFRGLVLVIHDTTQSVRYQELRKEFVANVSHELRTPLTVIKGYVETLRDGAMNDPVKCPEYLATIDRHAGQLTNLVRDLLELSRLESQQDLPSRQGVDITQCVRRAIDLLAPAAGKKNQTIAEELQPVPMILGNPDYIERAAANLIDNAVKYTGEGGRIAVSLRESGGNAVIEVCDNGIGIPKDDLPRIFERFYRVDRSRSREMGGTGLGLSIVKHIAQCHGGCVEVTSEPGQGSTFRLKIPIPQAVASR
ncbi:MAG: ATP-binding protein [Tepidisphaeraceae bacterium]